MVTLTVAFTLSARFRPPRARNLSVRFGPGVSHQYGDHFGTPLSSKLGTYKTVRTRIRSWLTGESPSNVLSRPLLARQRWIFKLCEARNLLPLWPVS